MKVAAVSRRYSRSFSWWRLGRPGLGSAALVLCQGGATAGNVLRLGWGNLPHGTHSRARSLPDAALAGDVDDYVGTDNPVRFIEAFVDGLDLQAAGFARVEPKPT